MHLSKGSMQSQRSRELGQSVFHCDLPSDVYSPTDVCQAAVNQYCESVRAMCETAWRTTERFSALLAQSDLSRAAAHLHSVVKMAEEVAASEVLQMRGAMESNWLLIAGGKNSHSSTDGSALQKPTAGKSARPDEVIMRSMVLFVEAQLSLFTALTQHLRSSLVGGSLPGSTGSPGFATLGSSSFSGIPGFSAGGSSSGISGGPRFSAVATSSSFSVSPGFKTHSIESPDLSKSKVSATKPSIIRNFLFGQKTPHGQATFYVPLDPENADRRNSVDDRSLPGCGDLEERGKRNQVKGGGGVGGGGGRHIYSHQSKGFLQKQMMPTLPSVEEHENQKIPTVCVSVAESTASQPTSGPPVASTRVAATRSHSDLSTHSAGSRTTNSLGGHFATDAELDLVIKMLSRRPASSTRPPSYTYPSNMSPPPSGLANGPASGIMASLSPRAPPRSSRTDKSGGQLTGNQSSVIGKVDGPSDGFVNGVVGKTKRVNETSKDGLNSNPIMQPSRNPVVPNQDYRGHEALQNGLKPSPVLQPARNPVVLQQDQINDELILNGHNADCTTSSPLRSNSIQVRSHKPLWGSSSSPINGEYNPIVRAVGYITPDEHRVGKHMSDTSVMINNKVSPVNPTWPLIDGVNLEGERLFGSQMWQPDDSSSMRYDDQWRQYGTWSSDRSSIMSTMMDSHSTCSDASINSDALYWYGITQQQQQLEQQQQQQLEQQQQQLEQQQQQNNSDYLVNSVQLPPPSETNLISAPVSHDLTSDQQQPKLTPEHAKSKLTPEFNLRSSDSGIGSELGRVDRKTANLKENNWSGNSESDDLTENHGNTDNTKENHLIGSSDLWGDKLLIDLGSICWSNPSAGPTINSSEATPDNQYNNNNNDLL